MAEWAVPAVVAALAVVGVAGVSGCHGGDGLAELVVVLDNDQFTPQQIDVRPGQMVRFVNQETDPHTVTSDPLDAEPGGPDSDARFPGGMVQGDSVTWVVPRGLAAGTQWFYHCRFHGAPGNGSSLGPGMTGVAVLF